MNKKPSPNSYQNTHFIFSKNVKIGTKCSTVIPDSPQKTPLEIVEFFYAYIFQAIFEIDQSISQSQKLGAIDLNFYFDSCIHNKSV